MFLPHFNPKLSYQYLPIISLSLILLASSNCFAETYNFIVQPIFKPKKIKRIYQPLLTYLNKETGHTFKLVTAPSFLSYWAKMKKGNYDLILDAAHFTDYRIKKLGYTVLVKIPDTVSFTLITHENDFILDQEELVGKGLITLPPPSLGSVRLNQMFPNPSRQPNFKSTDSAMYAINSVKEGKYFAALVPSPLLNQVSGVNTIETTQAVPHMAISASAKIDKALQIKIQQSLVNASNSKNGKLMLTALNISSFQATNKKLYNGYEKLLSDTWGY